MAPSENCLLGKIISDNQITDNQSVISILTNAWKKYTPSVIISPWKNNIFNFAFENKTDIPNILHDSPWSLMGFYLSLLPWDIDKTLNEMNFDNAEFWVQLHDLPLGLLTSEYATTVAESLGKLVELDCVGEGLQTDREFLRFRVEVDVTKPLVPGFFIPRSDGRETWALLKYEGLCDFCYRCGCLGHCQESCSNEVIAKYAGKWSSEMRTSSIPRLQAQSSNPLDTSTSHSPASIILTPTSPSSTTNTPNSPSDAKVNTSTAAKPPEYITNENNLTHPSIPPSSRLPMKRRHDDLKDGGNMTCNIESVVKDRFEVHDPLGTPNETPKVKEMTKKLFVPRMIVHPRFKNVTEDLAVKFLFDKEPGESILRPSSRGPSYLTLTLKVYNEVYAHKDILEGGKDDKNMTSLLHLGKTLKIGDDVCSDLDEVIARFVDPLVGHLKKMLCYRMFKHGTKAEVDESLRKEKYENRLRIVCCFSISHEYPGSFILTYIQTPTVNAHHEYIGLHSKGFIFRSKMFEEIDQLVAYFLKHIYDPCHSDNPTAIGGPGCSNTGRDNYRNNVNQDGGGRGHGRGRWSCNNKGNDYSEDENQDSDCGGQKRGFQKINSLRRDASPGGSGNKGWGRGIAIDGVSGRQRKQSSNASGSGDANNSGLCVKQEKY